jgi:hypothetical protein
MRHETVNAHAADGPRAYPQGTDISDCVRQWCATPGCAHVAALDSEYCPACEACREYDADQADMDAEDAEDAAAETTPEKPATKTCARCGAPALTKSGVPSLRPLCWECSSRAQGATPKPAPTHEEKRICKVCGRPALKKDGSYNRVAYCSACWTRKILGDNAIPETVADGKAAPAKAETLAGVVTANDRADLARAARKMDAAAGPARPKGDTVVLDFTGRRDLFRDLAKMARLDFRTIQDQILYYAARGVRSDARWESCERVSGDVEGG